MLILAEDDFCTKTRTDTKTGKEEKAGISLQIGEKTIASWVPGKGWFCENFAQTPVNKIKGWLEITSYLFNKIPTAEIGCDTLTLLRATSDTFAVVDEITTDKAVAWHPDMLRLYEGIRNKTKEISKALSVPPDGGDPANGTTPVAISKLLQSKYKIDIHNLSLATDLLHKSVKSDADDIQLPSWFDTDKISTILGVIALGVAHIPGGQPFAAFIGALAALVAGVGYVVAIINGIIDIVKRWFHW